VIVGRRAGAAAVGAALSCVLSVQLQHALAAATSFSRLRTLAPLTATCLERWMYGSLVGGLPVAGVGIVNFIEIHGLLRPARPRRRRLGPFPFWPRRLELVVGEIHAQNGSRSDDPG
jgi:hypothetical protein